MCVNKWKVQDTRMGGSCDGPMNAMCDGLQLLINFSVITRKHFQTAFGITFGGMPRFVMSFKKLVQRTKVRLKVR